jgi:hypothetical protein
MPVSDFRWLTREEIENLDVTNMSDKQETGYILEVDLVYPKPLHRNHNSFPLAPEHQTINDSMLSPYARGRCTLGCVTSPSLGAAPSGWFER